MSRLDKHTQAQAAFTACTTYVVTAGLGEEPSDEKIEDTLVGIMHLCDECGHNFDRLVQKASRSYYADIGAEDEQRRLEAQKRAEG